MQRPLELGADIVIHSATKYLDGQGRCIGGAVVGDAELVGKDVFGFLRTAGPSMSPFNAWVFLKGLETLSLRMQRHCDSALELAAWLEQQPAVERVYHPGLESHPQHALASRQQQGFGGIVSFEVQGGKDAAWRVIDATRVFSITANLGDTKSSMTHPATTTHGRLSPEQRQAAQRRQPRQRLRAGQGVALEDEHGQAEALGDADHLARLPGHARRWVQGYLDAHTEAPTAGSVHIRDHDLLSTPVAARRHLGYLPERPPLYPELQVDEYLHFWAQLHRIAVGQEVDVDVDAVARAVIAATDAAAVDDANDTTTDDTTNDEETDS